MSRIVSLVPSLTELVCDLGLAGELVGRTGFCLHPREALRKIPKVGGTKDVDLEKVRALAPTHVLVNVDENRKETAEALAAFVPNVVVTHPLEPLDNLDLYRKFGHLFGRVARAEALCSEFQTAYDGVKALRFPKRKVLYLIWKDPWMTVSRDTYISRTLALFGLDTLPVAAAERYPKLLLDEPWLDEVAWVLLSSEPYRFTKRHLAEMQQRLGKSARLIDAQMTSWYGSRAIRGLGYLADFARAL